MNSAQHIIHVSSSTAIPLDSTVILSLDDIAAHDAEEENDEDFLKEEPDHDWNLHSGLL